MPWVWPRQWPYGRHSAGRHRAGILFRNGEALERLAAVRAIRLDKTGTLTTGTPIVASFRIAAGEDRGLVADIAARLAAASTHCYARAIQRFVEEEGFAAAATPGSPPQVRTLPGADSCPNGRDLGRSRSAAHRLMDEAGLGWGSEIGPERQAGDIRESFTAIGWSGAVRGVFLFQEEIRAEAAAVIADLRRMGLDVAVLTGDGAGRRGGRRGHAGDTCPGKPVTGGQGGGPGCGKGCPWPRGDGRRRNQRRPGPGGQ